MKIATIIVAAGSGSRLGGNTPKQFLAVGGRMILERTIDRFAAISSQIVVVLAADYIEKYNFCNCTLVAGGDSRAASVRAGLAALGSDVEMVLIQDGVRPFTPAAVIDRVVAAATAYGAAVPAIPVTDSLRNSGGAIDRAGIYAVQTPQGFLKHILVDAYARNVEHCTDDAAVVELSGGKIAIVDGATKNIKITTPIDLKIAEMLADNLSVTIK